jgi:hypothetical protein
MVTLALAVLVLGAATTASARPKKHSAERTSTAITTCDGTPIIMQGIDCKKRPTGGEEQEQPTKRAERPRVTTRGSGGPYAPARLSTPSLALPQQSAGPYIPPSPEPDCDRTIEMPSRYMTDRIRHREDC